VFAGKAPKYRPRLHLVMTATDAAGVNIGSLRQYFAIKLALVDASCAVIESICSAARCQFQADALIETKVRTCTERPGSSWCPQVAVESPIVRLAPAPMHVICVAGAALPREVIGSLVPDRKDQIVGASTGSVTRSNREP
jgi:hypothetical protein